MGPVNAKPLQGVRKTHSEQTIDRMCQTTLEIIYRSDPGTVCDVRIRKLQKRTSSAADRKITESPTGRNPEIDCNNALKVERVDDFKPLPPADEGKL